MLPPPPAPDDCAALLAHAARVRACADVARSQALAVRSGLAETGLTGRAGDALAGLGEGVADLVVGLAVVCDEAADALVLAARSSRPTAAR